MWCGNDLQQPQIPRWVEEVRATKMFFKIFTSTFGHHVNGNTGSIRCDQGTRLTVFFNLLKHQLLNVKPLHHYLNDPVVMGNFLHIVIKIAGRDLLYNILCVNRGRIAFQSRLKGIIDELVPCLEVFAFFCFVGHDVQQ